MTKAITAEKIEFKRIKPEDKRIYDKYMPDGVTRGCEFSFTNLCIWGEQNFAEVADHLVLFSHFGSHTVYPYPIGKGDKRAVLDRIIADAKARGIPCNISGVTDEARMTLEELYPDMFEFHYNDGSFDYVYDINDLADLAGKKYHAKRNHLNRFREAHPNFKVVPIDDGNVDSVKRMSEEWYEAKLRENPESDFHMERAALEKALNNFNTLGLCGLIVLDGETMLAMAVASRMNNDTFDVHFEKARADVQGAYAAINCEFAKYIREKYDTVRYLDREEDMGIEGLRRAKESYRPHHQIKKCRARLIEK